MYVCTYIYIYVYTHTYTYACIYIYIYIYIYLFILIAAPPPKLPDAGAASRAFSLCSFYCVIYIYRTYVYDIYIYIYMLLFYRISYCFIHVPALVCFLLFQHPGPLCLFLTRRSLCGPDGPMLLLLKLLSTLSHCYLLISPFLVSYVHVELLVRLGGIISVRMKCPARCSGGRRPLIAGRSSLQRLVIDLFARVERPMA